ncbi:Dyp-type peroxidase [Corallincola spongiicola]|uniref:Dyp-type peroxidase n=1 Tax=Corallincola spongiicola TaxID=2520508 RepID=A0ABY1WLZ8_9GAMM|nr:Dyp-type peroxidase [Corallincola spongiicola]TAA41846.1 Dyp-type peroxidase [Corallincola spongiicola]
MTVSSLAQAGILAAVPAAGCYLTFSLRSTETLCTDLQALAASADGEACVVGIGLATLNALNVTVDGMKEVAALTGVGVSSPATPAALWCWLRGDERGELLHRAREIETMLAGSFELQQKIDGFKHKEGRDLTGYEDGTENPEGEAAVAATLLASEQPGLAGSSFVTAQLWRHNWREFDQMTQGAKDDCIGRRQTDNVEFSEAPPSAHVKRTAQESFTPEAFMSRRSMPWSDPHGSGLMFVCFANSFYPFEAQMKRMLGLEDGIVDGLFNFSQPQGTAYFWCPPKSNQGGLDLTALAL